MDRVSIKLRAKDRMRENRASAILPVLIYAVISALLGWISYKATYSSFLSLLLSTFSVGVVYCETEVWHGRGTATWEVLNQSFADYIRKLCGILWMGLWVFLWSILFVIPGIVKSVAYCLTPYILARYPGVAPRQALKISMRATEGFKADIFVFYLSFLGWMFLSGLTAGILYVLYVGPYMCVSYAGMSEALLNQAVQRGAVSREELA